jgi:biopolymer transport protein ExbB
MDMVAGGISEALVTTETGLVLALTGLVFQFVLSRQHQHYDELLVHLQALRMQEVRRGGEPHVEQGDDPTDADPGRGPIGREEAWAGP